MLINKIWNRHDISYLHDQFKNVRVFELKGIVFYKVMSDGGELFDQQMCSYLDTFGGCAVLSLRKEGIASLAKDYEGRIINDFLQATSSIETDRFGVIALTDKLFDEKNDTVRDFVIAHELGHVHFGDHENKEIIQRAEEGELICDLEKEIRADLFAVEVLGNKTSAMAFYEKTTAHYCRILEETKDPKTLDAIKRAEGIMLKRKQAVLNN